MFRTSGPWPRTTTLYRFPVSCDEWPTDPDTDIPGHVIPITAGTGLDGAPAAPGPAAAEVRAWARAQSNPVPDRGRLRPEIWDAWRAAHRADS